MKKKFTQKRKCIGLLVLCLFAVTVRSQRLLPPGFITHYQAEKPGQAEEGFSHGAGGFGYGGRVFSKRNKTSPVFSSANTFNQISVKKNKKETEAAARSWLKNEPVEFLENKGQMKDMAGKPAPYILFKAEAPGVDLYITEKGLSYVFLEFEEEQEKEEGPQRWLFRERRNRHEGQTKISYERLDMVLTGASILRQNVVTENPSPAYFNYLSKSSSVSGVKKYGRVTIKNIYPGIDWVLYNSNRTGFKYDFIVHAGADPAQVELVYHTLKKPELNADGGISLPAGDGTLTETAPYSYLQTSKQEVKSRFNLISCFKKDGMYHSSIHIEVEMNVPRAASSDLVIDPQLIWCTFYGGSSSEGVYAADTDPAGNLFLCCYNSSTDFPLLNAGTYYQTAAAGGCLLKFSNSGTLLWSTHFGSPGLGGGPFPPPSTTSYMATDINGNVFLCGVIASGILPAVNAGTYFQAASAGSVDAYIAKFDNAGNCLWSTYYGGSLTDQATGLATDPAGNVFLSGITSSTNFPLMNNGTYFEPTITGSNSGFITKFNNTGTIIWSTYLKGIGSSWITSDRKGNIYLTGSTNTIIPLLNPGGTAYYQGTIAGTLDAYLLKFDNNGSHLWGTYYGGNTSASAVTDMGTSIATDKKGNVFVSGVTTSTNFPTMNPGNGAYFKSTYSGGTGRDMFMLKFDSTGTRKWATLFGGTRNDSHTENDNMTIDTCGNVWLGFSTESRNLPFQQSCNGGLFDNSPDTSVNNAYTNVFLSRFSNNGNLLWSSYFGGDGSSHRCTWAADKLGNIFLSGEFHTVTNVNTYPVMNAGGSSYFSGYKGADDIFVAKMSMGLMTAQSFSYSSYCSNDTTGRLPLTQPGFPGGGTFSASPAGLSINSANGRVSPASSSPGSYTITYYNQNCDCPGATIAALGSATLTILPAPSLVIATNTLICLKQQVTVTANGASSYTWSTGPFTPSIAITHTATTPITYTVTGSNNNGCKAQKVLTITASKCTAIDELLVGAATLSIFPNPNAGEFTISASNDISFSLVNELGQFIKRIELNQKNERVVPINMLAPGVYFLKDEKGTVNRKCKIVVTQ